MSRLAGAFLLVAIACVGVVGASSIFPSTVGYQVLPSGEFKAVASSNASTLYSADVDGYDDPVYLIDLHGSRWQQGYDYGYLLCDGMEKMYKAFFESVITKNVLIDDAVAAFLDWQWADYLSVQMPPEYAQEIAGAAAGGSAACGTGNVGILITRIITLANLPGSPQDMGWVIARELLDPLVSDEKRLLGETVAAALKSGDLEWKTFGCSMMGVWGSRTADGSLYTGRNLDWTSDTGVDAYKILTVWHPPGKTAHVTVGFWGFVGALTGFSAYSEDGATSTGGLTVHEANLEEGAEITFDGFPWVLRLRYVMENANSIAEAKALWEATNNTVGFNFGVGSASDAKNGGHAFLAMETNMDLTEYFLDDSPVEAAAKVKGEQIGYPLKDALYRTNNPFSPEMMDYFSWGQGVGTNSEERYMLFYNYFNSMADGAISDSDAINITAIVGQKGSQPPNGDPYSCSSPLNKDGSNIISAVYHPIENIMYAAWSNGEGASWSPANCNTYVQVNMTEWW